MTMRRVAIWAALALMALSLFVWWVWPRVFGEAVSVNRVERRDVVQSVVATGRVETPYRVEIGTQISGVVADIRVIEGQNVKAGDVLILLDDGEAIANVELARAGILQAEGKITQLAEFSVPNARQAVDQADANAINAHNQFDRINQLASRGFATPVQLDEARRALDVATSQVQVAQLQLHAASPGGPDFVLATSALEQARATSRMADAKLGYMTIRAPADGIVITRAVELGTVAQPGKALLIVSPTRETRLVIQIDERNLGLIAVGQTALASSDAYGTERFKALLVFINPAVDPARGSVEIKLSVPEPPAYLREDMTVSVDIEVARRLNVLVLPANAVRDTLSTTPWVLKVENGKTLRKPIKIGARGVALIEILDGLAEGDQVVPATNLGTKSGQSVRARIL